MSTDNIKLSGAKTAGSDVSISSAVVKRSGTPVSAISAPDTTQENTVSLQPDNRSLAFNSPKASGAVTAHDVAAFILKQRGEMTAMKLQKLVYYCQAWSLVW